MAQKLNLPERWTMVQAGFGVYRYMAPDGVSVTIHSVDFVVVDGAVGYTELISLLLFHRQNVQKGSSQ